jgi:hypothetical protein
LSKPVSRRRLSTELTAIWGMSAKGGFLMFKHQSISKFGSSVIALTLWLSQISTSLGAVSLRCFYKDTIYNGEVDFGSGNHSGGVPKATGSVNWNFTSVNGAIAVTARVLGILYLDKIGAGCARLRINFQDSDGNNLQNARDVEFCGPGNNANSSHINVPSM